MFMIHHASYWNGGRFHAHTAQYDALKLAHDITLPFGGYFRLVILPSEAVMRPFGLQEDHFIAQGFGEGMAFLCKTFKKCHVALVVQDDMMFVALSKIEVPLLDLMEGYARDEHRRADYIPLFYAA
jgi:hypothetical protein